MKTLILIIAIIFAIVVIIRNATSNNTQELRINAILGWITILIMDLIALLH